MTNSGNNQPAVDDEEEKKESAKKQKDSYFKKTHTDLDLDDYHRTLQSFEGFAEDNIIGHNNLDAIDEDNNEEDSS